MALIDLTYSSESEFRSKLAATPNDWVAAGNSYRMLQTKSEIVFANPVTLENKITGPDNRLEIAYMPGASFMDSSDILTDPYAYDGSNGAAAAIALAYSPGFFLVKMPYVTFTGFQLRQAQGTGGAAIKVFPGGGDVTLDRCIIDGYGNSQYDWPLEINDRNFKARGCLIVHNSNLAYAVYLNSKTADFENVTFVRPSNFTKGGPAVKMSNGGNRFVNCLAVGFNDFVEGAGSGTIVLYSGCSGNIPAGAGNKANLLASEVLNNPLNDFKLKKVNGVTNPATDAGTTPSPDNTRAPNGVRQQGTAADMGSWETPSTLVAPTATVTDITVTGRTVVISGVTTGVPTFGTVSIGKSSAEYNDAAPQGPKAMTLGSGIFSCQFDNGIVGEYVTTLEVGNQAYTVSGSNPLGTFQIEGAKASNVEQTLDGQHLVITATLSGNPTSGSVILRAAAVNPDGASDQVLPMTVTGTSGRIDTYVTAPGNYDQGILRLVTAAGTSLPQPGTRAISIKSLAGNPQAPDPAETEPVEVTGVNVSPATATVASGGTLQLTVSVTGTSFPAQAVTWDTPYGSVDSSNLFTAPARSTDVTFNITATSVVDPDFSDYATVTVLAAVVAPPEVTSVVVTPATATTNGAAVQLSATVLGLNNPGQGVTWTTALGTVSSSGRYVPPALTSSARTTKVRATSTVDPTKFGEATITIEAAEIIIPEPGGDFVPSKSRTLTALAATGEFTGGAFWDLSNPARPVGRKDPDTSICVTIDWADVLDDLGEVSIGELNLYPEGFTVTGAKADGAKTTAVISGGVGPTSSLTFHISTKTLPTRSEERTVYFTIGDQ